MLYSNIHNDFIFTSALTVIEEAVNACSCIGNGMETYPLKDYMMQSLFLRMTGFQEQKLRCICWILATYDYKYRRSLLNDDDKLGEYSIINAKTSVYKRLFSSIVKMKDVAEISPESILQRTDIKLYVENCIKQIFEKTVFVTWAPSEFYVFRHNGGLFDENHFCTDKNTLLQNPLYDVYNSLYDHRNRCAHNTLSYQDNLPSFNTLKSATFYNNYFVWLALLLLIDEIFIKLFREYDQNIAFCTGR